MLDWGCVPSDLNLPLGATCGLQEVSFCLRTSWSVVLGSSNCQARNGSDELRLASCRSNFFEHSIGLTYLGKRHV